MTSADDANSKQLECLQQISDKLSLLLTKVDTINHNFQEWKDQTVTNPVVNAGANIGPTLVQLTNALERITALPQATPTTTVEGSDNFMEQEARKVKSQLATAWSMHLQARRQAFWQATRNRHIADKYDEWKQGETIILPQHLQMREIRGEPEDQRRIRERQVMDSLTTEIQLLGLRSESQKANYQEHDSKIKEDIERKVTGQLRTFVLKLWEEDCQRDEEISKKRWSSRNQPWLANYEEDFKKIYLNKNPFIKEGGTPQQPNTYAQVARNNQQNQRQVPNTRNANDWQIVNRGRVNQRRRGDYSEINSSNRPADRTNQTTQRNTERMDTTPVQTREGQAGAYSNWQNRREYDQPDPSTTAYQPNNARNRYGGRRQPFLEQERRENYRP